MRPDVERLEARRLLTSVTEYPVPLVGGLNAQPSEITAEQSGGPIGALFFIEAQGNEIGTVTAGSPNPQPYSARLATGANPEGITTDEGGDVWFTENGAN